MYIVIVFFPRTLPLQITLFKIVPGMQSISTNVMVQCRSFLNV